MFAAARISTAEFLAAFGTYMLRASRLLHNRLALTECSGFRSPLMQPAEGLCVTCITASQTRHIVQPACSCELACVQTGLLLCACLLAAH